MIGSNASSAGADKGIGTLIKLLKLSNNHFANSYGPLLEQLLNLAGYANAHVDIGRCVKVHLVL